MRATPIEINSPEDWQAIRKTGLGGSEAAAVLGVSPYATPLDVFLDKMGLIPPKDESPQMKLGKRLESVVADLYTEETGLELTPCPLLRHADPQLHWLIGSPDRLVKGQEMGLEIKSAGLRMAHEWGTSEDAVPMSYLLQSAHYMCLLGYDRWDLAVLIGGQEFRIYHLQRDMELEGYLLEIAGRFWRDFMETNTPPPLTYSETTRTWLAHKYPIHSTMLLTATEEAEQWARAYAEAKARIAVAEREAQDAQINLQALIGEAAGIAGTGWRATWKRTQSNGYDYKALVEELKVSAGTLARFRRPGYRRFSFHSDKE